MSWRCRFFGHDMNIVNGPNGHGIYHYEYEPAANGRWVHKHYKQRCYWCGRDGWRKFTVEFQEAAQ